MKEGFGDFIKHHRIASGYKSQRKLAEKTGISPATISRIESEIQKPEMETLKVLAPYLESTSLVELMVKCGYWNEDELLETSYDKTPINKESVISETTENFYSKGSNEKDFLKSIDLTDQEIIEQFDLKIDGSSLTEDETKHIIAYIRSLRQMEK